VEKGLVKAVFLHSRMLRTDEYDRVKESTLTFLEFLEALCRLADLASEGEWVDPRDQRSDLDANLQALLERLLGNLARTHKGVIYIELPGHRKDGRRGADLRQWYVSREGTASRPPSRKE
jgi:hypothetical protein